MLWNTVWINNEDNHWEHIQFGILNLEMSKESWHNSYWTPKLNFGTSKNMYIYGIQRKVTTRARTTQIPCRRTLTKIQYANK